MQRGFTLVELMVTLAILGVLATLTVPLAQLQAQRGREQDLRLALREIRSAIDAYKRASDEGRIRRGAASTGYPPSLEILVDGVEDQRDPQRRKLYFLRRVPRNPFHADAAAEPAATWGKRSYASEPNEPAEGEDIYDVYVPTPLVGLNGVAIRTW